MTSSGEYRQRIRFALANLSASNGQFVFERVCLELARVTVSPSVMPATGPVSAGGDQGRDFETFPSRVPGRAGPEAVRAGIGRDDEVTFACTLQKQGISAKVAADVERVLGSGRRPDWIVVFCEVNVPVAKRHAIQDRLAQSRGARVVIFDGDTIADLLAFHADALAGVTLELLQVAVPAGRVVPHVLPRNPQRFVNRRTEMGRLDELADAAVSGSGPRIAVLAGMHGVGKSATAARWAHRNRHRFPDGGLYGDLSRRRRGSAVDISEVLADFLRDLGVADVAIPAGFAERRRLFERATADRQLLVVLDDVDQPAQAVAMLPIGATSMVIVTTAFHLDELVLENADFVSVEPLDMLMSKDLLESIVTDGRLEREPDATAKIIDICGGLPIGLNVCGGSLAAHPTRTVGWLADSITDHEGRRDSRTPPVFDTFDFAYHDLGTATQITYRRLGLIPGRDFELRAAAAIVGATNADTESALRILYDAYLVAESTSGRFRFHDLVREHASKCATADEAESERDAAVRRLVDWYRLTLRSADRGVVADRLRLDLELPEPDLGSVPTFAVPADAFAWFADERSNVIAVVREAFDRELDVEVCQIAEAMWPLCASHKMFDEWIESHRRAVDASVRLRDRDAEARFRSQLARAFADIGDAQRADAEIAASRQAIERTGNERLYASVIEFSGVCDLRLGRPAAALGWFDDARRRLEGTGSTRAVALVDYYSGCALVLLDRPEEALVVLDEAELGLVATADQISVGRVHRQRGQALRNLELFAAAEDELVKAVEMMRTLGIGFEEAETLEALGSLADARHLDADARRYRQRAFNIYEQLGHPRADALLASLGAG